MAVSPPIGCYHPHDRSQQ